MESRKCFGLVVTNPERMLLNHSTSSNEKSFFQDVDSNKSDSIRFRCRFDSDIADNVILITLRLRLCFT